MGLSNGIQFNGFVSLVLGSTMLAIGVWTCWIYTRPVVSDQYITVKCSPEDSRILLYSVEFFDNGSYTGKLSGINISEIDMMIREKCIKIEESIESSLVRHSMWIVCLSLAQILSACFVLPSLTNEVFVIEAKHWIMLQCLILCSYCLSFVSQASSFDRMTNFRPYIGLQITDSYASKSNDMISTNLHYHSDYVLSFLWSVQTCIVLGFINVFFGGIFTVCLFFQNKRCKKESEVQLV